MTTHQPTGTMTIDVKVSNGIATLSLNRAAQRNAVNLAMCLEMQDALKSLSNDQTVKLVVLRANGPVFSAGADLRERKTMDADGVRNRRHQGFAMYDCMESFPKPLVAVVEGAAIGAGAEIATSCDFVIATESATVRYPEVALGTVGATQRLPEIVGKRMAKELLFTGRTVDALEAQRLGIFNRVVSVDALEQTLDLVIAPIAQSPTEAVSLAKHCINARFDTGRRAAEATERQAIEVLLAGPNWRGRMENLDTPVLSSAPL